MHSKDDTVSLQNLRRCRHFDKLIFGTDQTKSQILVALASWCHPAPKDTNGKVSPQHVWRYKDTNEAVFRVAKIPPPCKKKKKLAATAQVDSRRSSVTSRSRKRSHDDAIKANEGENTSPQIQQQAKREKRFAIKHVADVLGNSASGSTIANFDAASAADTEMTDVHENNGNGVTEQNPQNGSAVADIPMFENHVSLGSQIQQSEEPESIVPGVNWYRKLGGVKVTYRNTEGALVREMFYAKHASDYNLWNLRDHVEKFALQKMKEYEIAKAERQNRPHLVGGILQKIELLDKRRIAFNERKERKRQKHNQKKAAIAKARTVHAKNSKLRASPEWKEKQRKEKEIDDRKRMTPEQVEQQRQMLADIKGDQEYAPISRIFMGARLYPPREEVARDHISRIWLRG